MVISNSSSEHGIDIYPFLMNSVQSSLHGNESLSPVDSFSMSRERKDEPGKPNLVDLTKINDTSVTGNKAGASHLAEMTEETLKMEGKGYSIDIKYPQIVEGSGIEAAKTINSRLQSFVRERASSFESDALQAEPMEGTSSFMEMGFPVSLNNDRALSLMAGSSSYVAGCAHPSNELCSFNFDMRTGRTITFSELFRVDEETPDRSHLFRDNLKARRERENYILKRVSEYCTADLKRQNEGRPDDEQISESLISDVAAPEPGRFDLFNITENELVINFYYCHAAGYGEVRIPFEALADIIDPESIIGQYAKPVEEISPDKSPRPEVVTDDEMIIIDDVRLKINK